MNIAMTFPDTVDEFMEQYKMTDTECVYSNGIEYVPIFRMKQWFEHCQNMDNEKAELLWCINYMATCDNCKYFGGCCCNHVDGDGICLGWELLRKPTEEERKAYDEYMAEAVGIAKQVLEERKHECD